jgi:hypothetical protein
MTEFRLLTKDEILQADDFEYRLVEVPEWAGGDASARVRVRSLSGEERDQLEARAVKFRGQKPEVNTDALKNFRANLVSLSIVDDAGERVFSDKDVDALGRKSSKALQRVFNACQELSAFSEEDIAELTGELSEDPTDGSSSD